MISTNLICAELARHNDFVSVVELAMILEASASEIRQRLNELSDLVVCNDNDEYRLVGELVHKLALASPLSVEELKERNELEKTVQQAFFIAGQALKILKDKKLYRETHSTFEKYIRNRFDFTRAAAYYLINASEVVTNLKCQPLVDILPTSERQCRPIAKLPPEQQRKIWLKAVKKADGKVPSGKIVKEIVNEMRNEPEMEPKSKRDRIVSAPGMETEYLIYSDRETYELLQAYKEKTGAATNNGAIRRLLDEENRRSGA